MKGSFLVQLISYFQAFGEQGYRANMTDKRKQAIHQRGGKKARFVGPVRGHRFFVAYGRDRDGARRTRKGDFDVRTSHLRPGIWAASGTGGVDLRPVLLLSALAITRRVSVWMRCVSGQALRSWCRAGFAAVSTKHSRGLAAEAADIRSMNMPITSHTVTTHETG